MKHKKLVITFLSVAAFAVGCKPTEENSTAVQENRDIAAAQLEKAKENMKAAEKDYAYAQKSEFVEKMQKELAEINRDREKLSAKIENSSAAAKAEAKPKLQALREKADKVSKQLDDAKEATESTWDDVKAGSRKAYNELKDSFQQARQWVSEKIAP